MRKHSIKNSSHNTHDAENVNIEINEISEVDLVNENESQVSNNQEAAKDKENNTPYDNFLKLGLSFNPQIKHIVAIINSPLFIKEQDKIKKIVNKVFSDFNFKPYKPIIDFQTVFEKIEQKDKEGRYCNPWDTLHQKVDALQKKKQLTQEEVDAYKNYVDTDDKLKKQNIEQLQDLKTKFINQLCKELKIDNSKTEAPDIKFKKNVIQPICDNIAEQQREKHKELKNDEKLYTRVKQQIQQILEQMFKDKIQYYASTFQSKFKESNYKQDLSTILKNELFVENIADMAKGASRCVDNIMINLDDNDIKNEQDVKQFCEDTGISTKMTDAIFDAFCAGYTATQILETWKSLLDNERNGSFISDVHDNISVATKTFNNQLLQCHKNNVNSDLQTQRINNLSSYTYKTNDLDYQQFAANQIKSLDYKHNRCSRFFSFIKRGKLSNLQNSIRNKKDNYKNNNKKVNNNIPKITLMTYKEYKKSVLQTK